MFKNNIKEKIKYYSNEQYFVRSGTIISLPQLLFFSIIFFYFTSRCFLINESVRELHGEIRFFMIRLMDDVIE